ncbi:hypothetical protein ACFVXE_35260 [Streptomyces sp. NPDC058231]|uniref:hypothetical protein n=1 Tax=Streptomyces sp. NPDC058231 TaxID=3346392 RepID=UPI0036E92DB1
MLTARRPEELHAWAAPYGERVLVLQLDVTDAEQIRSAVSTAQARFDAIDAARGGGAAGHQRDGRGAGSVPHPCLRRVR